MINPFAKIKARWQYCRYYVILDPADSSITFSRHLFRSIEKMIGHPDKPPKAFAFYVPATERYGFIINPDFEQPTQLADIQYNTKHRCIGFESLNPTVARIMYDYGIKTLKPCKLSVRLRLTPEYWYYQIEKPNEKSTRNIQTL